jgi:hypothetical protein
MSAANAHPTGVRPDHPTGSTPTDSHVRTYKRTDRDGADDTSKTSSSSTHTHVQDLIDSTHDEHGNTRWLGAVDEVLARHHSSKDDNESTTTEGVSA